MSINCRAPVTLLPTPLRLTRHTIVIAIHLRIRAIADEELGFVARPHLRTVLAPIAAVGIGGLGQHAFG